MICTFPSKKYDINKYLAIKNYLLQFGKEKLEQTGKKHVINGIEVRSRKKTNNKWFETQDSIAYSDLFYEQKIVYPCIMSRGPAFALDNNGSYFVVAPGNIIVGEKLQYLIDCLNSKIFYFALRKFYMGGGIEGELKTNRLLMLPIPNIGTDSTSEDDLIRILGLTNNEVEHINNEYSQLLK